MRWFTQITANDMFFLPSCIWMSQSVNACFCFAPPENGSFATFRLFETTRAAPLSKDTHSHHNFSYYVTQYYCILLFWKWTMVCVIVLRKETEIKTTRPTWTVCSIRCVFARCVYLAAMSSPFNIIFTIQSDYTSYSFMSSHINDFIMCSLPLARSIALHLMCFGAWREWAKRKFGQQHERNKDGVAHV